MDMYLGWADSIHIIVAGWSDYLALGQHATDAAACCCCCCARWWSQQRHNQTMSPETLHTLLCIIMNYKSNFSCMTILGTISLTASRRGKLGCGYTGCKFCMQWHISNRTAGVEHDECLSVKAQINPLHCTVMLCYNNMCTQHCCTWQ